MTVQLSVLKCCQRQGQPGAASGCGGFTLLEIMLATLILALVVSMITLSLSGSLNVMDATRNQGEVYFRAQVAMERLSDDLASAVLPERADFVGQPPEEGGGERPLLSFVSTAHVIFDPTRDQKGLAAIDYALKPDPEEPDMLVLLRSDRLLVPDAGREEKKTAPLYYLLADRLRSLRFVYLDRHGEEVESWDTRLEEGAGGEERDKLRRLPSAVHVELEYWLDREEERTLVFQTTVELPAGRIRIVKEEE